MSKTQKDQWLAGFNNSREDKWLAGFKNSREGTSGSLDSTTPGI